MNSLLKLPFFAAVAAAAMADVNARHSEYRIDGHTPRRSLPAAEAKRLRRMERNKRGAR